MEVVHHKGHNSTSRAYSGSGEHSSRLQIQSISGPGDWMLSLDSGKMGEMDADLFIA